MFLSSKHFAYILRFINKIFVLWTRKNVLMKLSDTLYIKVL